MGGLLNLHPKVAGGGLTGALALIILWGVSYAIKVPVEVGAAFTVVLGFVGGYFAPILAKEQPGVAKPVQTTPPAPPAA